MHEARRIVGAFLILASGSLATCSSEEANEAEQLDYFPLHDAAEWNYTMKMGPIEYRATIKVDGTQTINGVDYFKIVTTASSPDMEEVDPVIVFWRKAEDGIRQVKADDESQEEMLLLPLPLEIGRTWTTGLGGKVSAEYRVEAIEDAVLPGRTFANAVKVAFRNTGGPTAVEGFSYYAPGVGLVRLVTQTTGVTADMTLDSYE
jgi:hypothetical protein